MEHSMYIVIVNKCTTVAVDDYMNLSEFFDWDSMRYLGHRGKRSRARHLACGFLVLGIVFVHRGGGWSDVYVS